jgi:DNA repair exonuclease SbcCD ATPase subunit
MSAIELNERLTDLTEEITQINEQTKLLTQKRTSALSEQNEDAAKTIRHQLQEFQERLEDITIMKTAVENKLRVYKKNSQDAAEIRKRVAGELWPHGTKVFSKMQQALGDLSNALKEMDQLNGSIQGLAVEHEKLIGDSVAVPMIFIPGELRSLVNVRLPDLPETLELKVRSQEIHEAHERQDAAFNERMSKQKTLLLPLLESANYAWPKCKVCGAELVCIGGSIFDGMVETGLGGPPVQKKAFALQFRCEVAGPHNGAKGFIAIEGGPYDTVPLSRLPIDF